MQEFNPAAIGSIARRGRPALSWGDMSRPVGAALACDQQREMQQLERPPHLPSQHLHVSGANTIA
jgi:hypothetical protein